MASRALVLDTLATSYYPAIIRTWPVSVSGEQMLRSGGEILHRAITIPLVTLGLLTLFAGPVSGQQNGSSRSSKTVSADKTGVLMARGAAAIRRTMLSTEDLRLGDFVAPARSFPFPLLGDDKAREIYVDRKGAIYKKRRYSGLVPDWSSGSARRQRTRRCTVQRQPVTWVGFQNHELSSRVFIQVGHHACGYVYRPHDSHIVVDLPAVYIDNANLKREVLTGAFPTPVELIHVDQIEGKGVRVTIALKKRRRYLSAHLGRYVFVDIAR